MKNNSDKRNPIASLLQTLALGVFLFIGGFFLPNSTFACVRSAPVEYLKVTESVNAKPVKVDLNKETARYPYVRALSVSDEKAKKSKCGKSDPDARSYLIQISEKDKELIIEAMLDKRQPVVLDFNGEQPNPGLMPIARKDISFYEEGDKFYVRNDMSSKQHDAAKEADGLVILP